MRKSLWMMVAVLLAAVATPTVLMASPLTYNFNQTFGPGSVHGTLTTDGTIGVLGAANIVSWNLVLNDGTATVILLPATTSVVVVVGTDLVASATGLMFNYSAGDGGDFYFGGIPRGELCYTSFSNCWGPPGVGVWNLDGNAISVFTFEEGNQIIATATETPEPASLVLLGSGLVGLASGIRRKLMV
jgi:hypothetical protein